MEAHSKREEEGTMEVFWIITTMVEAQDTHALESVFPLLLMFPWCDNMHQNMWNVLRT